MAKGFLEGFLDTSGIYQVIYFRVWLSDAAMTQGFLDTSVIYQVIYFRVWWSMAAMA